MARVQQGLTGSCMASIKRLLIGGAAALAVNACYGPLVFAQQAGDVSEAAAPQIITSVAVEGNQRIETATVLAYVAIQPGEAFSPERIDIALKTLFATGFFANVEFEQRGQTLVVKVAENPTVNQVLFEGNKSRSSRARGLRKTACRPISAACRKSIAGRANLPPTSCPRSRCCRLTASTSSLRSTKAARQASARSILLATRPFRIHG
jgi:hypothetical protein